MNLKDAIRYAQAGVTRQMTPQEMLLFAIAERLDARDEHIQDVERERLIAIVSDMDDTGAIERAMRLPRPRV